MQRAWIDAGRDQALYANAVDCAFEPDPGWLREPAVAVLLARGCTATARDRVCAAADPPTPASASSAAPVSSTSLVAAARSRS